MTKTGIEIEGELISADGEAALLEALHDMSMDPNEQKACSGRFMKAVIPVMMQWLIAEKGRKTELDHVLSAFCNGVVSQIMSLSTAITKGHPDAAARTAEVMTEAIGKSIPLAVANMRLNVLKNECDEEECTCGQGAGLHCSHT